MTDIIARAKELAKAETPHMVAEVENDPEWHGDTDCFVRIVEKEDRNSIWYEGEHGGYEHGVLHDSHVFAFAPETVEALAQDTWEYACQIFTDGEWELSGVNDYSQHWGSEDKAGYTRQFYEELGEKARIVRRRVSPVEVVANG